MGEQGLSIKKNMIWNSVGSIFYLGTQWLITVLVVRLSSGYDAAGQLALAMSFATLFTPFAMYKIRAYQVSDVDKKYSTGEYVGFRIVTIAGSFVGIMLYALLTADTSIWLAIVFYVLFKSVDVFTDVLHGVDQVHGRMDFIGQSFLLRGSLTFVAFCSVLFLTNNITLAILAEFLVTVPVLVFFDLKKAGRFENLKPKFNRSSMKSLLVECFPNVLASFFTSGITTIPRQYLSFVFGNTLLGIYSSVANPVLIIQMGAQYVYGPLLVPFSKLFHERKLKEFKGLLLKVSLAILGIGLVAALLFVFLGEHILVFFYGESIIGNTYLLQPMLVSTLLTAYLWFLADLLIIVRSMKGNLIGSILAFATSIASMFLLVNFADMNGVSFTIIAANAVGVIAMVLFLLHALKQKSQISDHAEQAEQDT